MAMLPAVLGLLLIGADGPGPAGPDAAWQLTLPEAIRIGLENSPVVRVVGLGAGAGPAAVAPGRGGRSARIAVAPLNPDPADPADARFRAAIMAHLRSIEQAYWAVGLEQCAVRARELEVKLSEDLLARERARRDPGRPSDIAAAEVRVGSARAALINATTDLATTDRCLRTILGLPAADGRRIIPATALTKAAPDVRRDDALALMLAIHPDLEGVRREWADAVRAGDPAEIRRRRAFYDQVADQLTKGLDRFLRDIRAEHGAIATADGVRSEALGRLEASRAARDEGRGGVAPVCEAIRRYADAVDDESRQVACYNSALAAFEEARGTLPAYEGIAILPAAVPAGPPARP